MDRLRIDTLRPSLFEELQRLWNKALDSEQKDVDDHADHDPFHFDYVDRIIPTISLLLMRRLFIGITIPLVNRMWEMCGTRAGPTS